MTDAIYLEAMARAMCEAEGVDPERACHGMGRLIPRGEVWPAWKVRLPYAEAAMIAYKRLLEIRLGEHYFPSTKSSEEQHAKDHNA